MTETILTANLPSMTVRISHRTEPDARMLGADADGNGK